MLRAGLTYSTRFWGRNVARCATGIASARPNRVFPESTGKASGTRDGGAACYPPNSGLIWPFAVLPPQGRFFPPTGPYSMLTSLSKTCFASEFQCFE